MLSSYTLHFFAVISAISVLAAPTGMPKKRIELFDFDPAHDEVYGVVDIVKPEGQVLARGNWLRKAHPHKVRIISNQTCTHLTYCSLKMSNR
jgi:hypothetical protein